MTKSPAVHRTPALRAKPLVVAISSILATSLAHADQAASPAAGTGLDEIVVTAQKRVENLQSVPISIQALDTKKLAELQVGSFDDYARYLPSLSVQSYGPGQAQLYVRGVTNGGDGVHVGSQPLVGVYLDEMPVTTISNNLDIHVYDVQRVEALSGPQGTLFGASSMAGTMRIITNKPDPTKFEAGYDVTANTFTDGGPGGKLEGFVNLPISDKAAIRLVGWDEHDGGYINNIRSSPQYFPTSGAVRDNAEYVKKNSNTVETAGGRLALKLALNDTWTVSPSVMTQNQTARGQYAYTPYPITLTPTYPDGHMGPPMTLGGTGDLNISRYADEINRDGWTMGTLVVEGKVSDLDLTYAGGYIKRHTFNVSDYSDYSLFYDVAYAASPQYYGNAFVNKNGAVINPAQVVIGTNYFTKTSNELRLATPSTWRLHGVVGLFAEKQANEIRYDYITQDASPAISVSGSPGTIWMEHAFRTDRDSALYTDMTFDATSKLAFNGGIRLYRYDNTIDGYFGFSNNFPSSSSPYSGENLCTTPILDNHSEPCQNLNNRGTKQSETHRLNATYKFDDDKMVYGTWSTGFRPGGVNRLINVPPYNPDYLTNFELGSKTSWFDHRLRLNGAVFYERWKEAQFAYPGQAGVNVVINAGRAAIKGVEAEVHWKATDGLTLSTSLTYLDTELLTNVCHYPSPSLNCTEPSLSGNANAVFAPAGSRLPVSSKIKGNTIARYEWTVSEYRAHAQAATVYQSNVLPALRTADEQTLGTQPGYGSVDFAAGVAHNSWTAELYVQNAFDNRGQAIRYTGCATATCKLVDVIPIKPRLVGLTFGQRF